MLKRLSTLFFAVVFATTATASTIGADAVRSAIQEFNYSVSVEWDQQDPAFYQAQVEKLKAELAQLKEQGVTSAQIAEAAVSGVKDAKLAQEMKEALVSIEASKLSLEEAQAMVLEAARNTNARGASWSSDVFVWIGPVIGIALVIALLAGGSSSGNGETPSNPGNYGCGYNWVHYWGYDSWGNYRYMSDYVWSCGYYY
jgi:hypothetical protein